MGNAVGPFGKLAIEVLERVEGSGGEERIAQVADGSLDSAFLISAGGRDGLWSKVVMPCELEKSRMKPDDVADTLKDGCFQVVVEKSSRHALKRGKRGDAATQKTLERRVERTKRQGPARRADRDGSEARPVDLSGDAPEPVEFVK